MLALLTKLTLLTPHFYYRRHRRRRRRLWERKSEKSTEPKPIQALSGMYCSVKEKKVEKGGPRPSLAIQSQSFYLQYYVMGP
jgi:hypothetical protein